MQTYRAENVFYLCSIFIANCIFGINTTLYIGAFIWNLFFQGFASADELSYLRVYEKLGGLGPFLIGLYPIIYAASVFFSWSLYNQASENDFKNERKLKVYAVLVAFIPILYWPIDIGVSMVRFYLNIL